MSKVSKACDISPAARKSVLERDNARCIVCGNRNNIQIAHYISRARLGLGIEENLACLCVKCHIQYDNGFSHEQIKIIFSNYLKSKYPKWNEQNLIYKKYKEITND